MITLAFAAVLGLLQSPPQVPLSEWSNADFPTGINYGAATGISFGDFDGDGFSDVFAYASANLWNNVNGTTWQLKANLNNLLPTGGLRYGSAFADYDNDGLADIGVEPREGYNDDCFHLLKNLGNGAFTDIAPYSSLIDQQLCAASSETLCWGDVDGDHDLDLFIPIYPEAVGSIGNKFLHNLGPTGPNQLYRFAERASSVGLRAPINAGRPEGTFMLDIDGDGDLEVYSNGTLYRNDSSYDSPLFSAFDPTAIGIRKQTIVDEGVYFFDYDMDGDMDVLINYTGNHGFRIWESRGDGTWFQAPSSAIEDFRNGATFGLSVADYDGDGDLDFQGLNTFRRNMLIESGIKYFELASHQINSSNLQGSTFAWGDWDRDGDIDALSATSIKSTLLENTTNTASTLPSERKDLRVRVINNSTLVARGLETEYGASVEVIVKGDELRRRKQIVSSASGYLTQNEYALTFALPSPSSTCEIVVDFPSLPELGFHRVDKFVNPILGAIDVALLNAYANSPQERELSVFRDGTVHWLNKSYRPTNGGPLKLDFSNELIQASISTAPPAPTTAANNEMIGMEIVVSAGNSIHIKQLEIDGAANSVRTWNVTDPNNIYLVSNSFKQLVSGIDNHRNTWQYDLLLSQGVYRIVAEVSELRQTAIAAPIDHGRYSLSGGLNFIDANPATAASTSSATVDPNKIGMRLLVADVRPDWINLGEGSDPNGNPQLSLSGTVIPQAQNSLTITSAPPFAKVILVAGQHAAGVNQGTMRILPELEQIAGPFSCDSSGKLNINVLFPATLQVGETWLVQALVQNQNSHRYLSTNVVAAISQ